MKNVAVAFCFLVICLLGSTLADQHVEPLVLYFALMAFIAGFGVEVMLDISDVEGDHVAGVNTLPLRFGGRIAAMVVAGTYLVLASMDPLPFLAQIDHRLHLDAVFLAVIMIPATSYLLISWSLLRNPSPANAGRLRKAVVAVMCVGSGAYLLGVLV